MIIADFGDQILICMDLAPGNDIYFEEVLICFNFDMTFAMIIQDFRGQISTLGPGGHLVC